MPFEYLDHTADVCLRGIGETIGEAFSEAAKAMFNLMVDVDQVTAKQSLKVFRDASTPELLLVEWLSGLLIQKDLTGLYCSRFCVDIAEKPDGLSLEATAWGESLDLSRHCVKLEVKGVTYSGLHVVQKGKEWIAQCVVDI